MLLILEQKQNECPDMMAEFLVVCISTLYFMFYNIPMMKCKICQIAANINIKKKQTLKMKGLH